MTALAEVFPPGEFLREELEERGWNQTELAEIIGRPVRLINEIIAGKKAITPETALQLGEALGTGPDVWMNLESQYQLSLVSSKDNLISRRAHLYEKFPVREMMKRGWIEATKDIDVLETQFLRFFGLKSINDEPEFMHAAKKTNADEVPSKLQWAWLFRARMVASEIVCGKYSPERLRQSLQDLSKLLSAPEEARHVARILGESGVRFVIVEPIPGSKIDGACFWIDESPVIALTLRLDRIDNFWFVLRHEIEHVLNNDGRGAGFILDQDVFGESNSTRQEEVLANEAAANFCVSRSELEHFIARVGPFYSEERVVLFSRRLQVHPGIVVGQLQKRLGQWSLLRRHQVKIRHLVVSSARTDGWGVFLAR